MEVLEFNVEIFKAWNMQKSGKILETVILTWKMQMFITLLNTHAFV